MPKRARILYVILALLLSISLTYRIREISDRLGLLVYPDQHVRSPLGLTLAGAIVELTAEAEMAGLEKGDKVLVFGGRPYRGAVDFQTPLRVAKPGDRLNVEVGRANGITQDASIELMPYRTAPLTTSEILGQIVGNIIPLFCVLLGFWVAAVRIRDPRAWILMVLLNSFAELNGGLGRTMYGHDDFFQPIGLAYQQFSANLWGAAFLMFGIYFPERAELDRRFPWAKWLLIGPALVLAMQDSASDVLAGRHIAWSMAVDQALPIPPLTMFFLNMSSIGGFFSFLGYKTFTATNSDMRRRLRLLYAGASVSMTPTFIVILFNIIVWRRPDTQNATIPLFVMLVGFPVTMAYVILVERAMDVRVVLRQGLQYLLASKGVIVIQVVLSFMVIFTAASLSIDGLNRPQRISLMARGIFAIALIQLFAKKVRAWIDRRFFREAYDAEQILSELANKVRTIVETGPLLEMVANRISESMHVSRVAVLLNGGDAFRLAYAVGYSGAPDFEIPANSPDVEKATRDRLDAELVLPLSLNRRVLGLLSLGPKRSEEPYSKADVRLLGSVAAQTGLALENSRLTAEIAAEVAQRERLNREIEIAREVQERLFPQELPEVSGLDYFGLCRPALGVGGDYYDFLMLPDNQLGIAIGDVSGKGIPAALLMASLRASLRGQTIEGANDLAALMGNVNKLVYESSSSNRYATFFYAQYDPAARILAYVNGGHNPPLIFRKSGKVLRLETGGPVVGLLPAPLFRYDQAFVTLEPGDVLVAFTDGISEAMNSADEEWGEDRLVECVSRLQDRPAREIISTVVSAADEFAAGAVQHDDMTLIVAKVS